MSVMSELAMKIDDLCLDGFTNAEIAERLNIPLEMVVEYLGEEMTDEMLDQFDQGYAAAKDGLL